MPGIWLKRAADVVVLLSANQTLFGSPTDEVCRLDTKVITVIACLEWFGRRIVKNDKRALFGLPISTSSEYMELIWSLCLINVGSQLQSQTW